MVVGQDREWAKMRMSLRKNRTEGIKIKHKKESKT